MSGRIRTLFPSSTVAMLASVAFIAATIASGPTELRSVNAGGEANESPLTNASGSTEATRHAPRFGESMIDILDAVASRQSFNPNPGSLSAQVDVP